MKDRCIMLYKATGETARRWQTITGRLRPAWGDLCREHNKTLRSKRDDDLRPNSFANFCGLSCRYELVYSWKLGNNDFHTHYNNTARCSMESMDTEDQDVPLLAPFPGSSHSIKVFPFIVHLKRDVIVSRQRQLGLPFLSPTFFSLLPRVAP